MATFRAFRTQETESGFSNSILNLDKSTLESGEVIIKVAYSGINYKDLLSSQGNKGITRTYPHTPGVDASGYVVRDLTNTFSEGDEVVVMGYDLGMNTDGGFAEYISVPSSWVLAKPDEFTLEETMRIGTSGFTAALGIKKILQAGVTEGPIVVSGATGGVGMWAVQMLTYLGFEVWAVSGKKDASQILSPIHNQLNGGNNRNIKILSREEILLPNEKPISRPRWTGGFDTVGGETLSSILKQTHKEGAVATCGNVGGAELPITVLPFILNGIHLLGINAADTKMEARKDVWKILAKIANPNIVKGEKINIEGIENALLQMKEGRHTSRFLVEFD